MDRVKEKVEQGENIWLSVVIIGRNEGLNLPALFDSLPGGERIEWIYVDSASVDNSVKIAREKGARVLSIDKDNVYAPGTGRYVGTKEARGKWILYLDGDMVLRPEFIPFIEKLRSAVAEGSGDLPQGAAAFVGRTINHCYSKSGAVTAVRDYVVLPKRAYRGFDSWGREAGYHGGAVLYRRDMVMKAGNWNPAVYQLEEIDLLSRVKKLGGRLRAVDLPMADHSTPHLGLRERLKMNFLAEVDDKKLYGAGQVVAARYREGGLFSFIRAYPQPFVVLAGILLSPALYFVWRPLPDLVNLTIIIWIGLTKKWYYYLVYLGNVIQMIRGLGRYRRFEPAYREIVDN